MQDTEMGFNRAMLLLVLPPEVDVSDAAAVEHAIEGIDQDRIYLTGGSIPAESREGAVNEPL
jgi:hypothetical protein